MNFKTEFKLELPKANKTKRSGQTGKRKRYQKDTAPADDIVTLIHLVRQNPALYNYKLQPNQRRRIDVLNGWAQIAVQIGNKYTVEECRRKWKNLRDTYHQYRLRKPKLGDGLSKWRYAKELEFLSNVYQPKLKALRQPQHQHYDTSNAQKNLMHSGHEATIVRHDNERNPHKNTDNELVHHSSITLVNDDAETFILTAYEDVNDDMDHATAHMELSHHHDVTDVTEIVKNEHSLDGDDDGATAEVDYEEVCMYEEAGNAPSVDCETIIPGNVVDVGSGPHTVVSPNEEKSFQYIDENDFCIESISAAHAQLPSANGSGAGGLKFTCSAVKVKNMIVSNTSEVPSTSSNVSVFTTAPLPTVVLDNNTISPTATIAASCNTVTTSTTTMPLTLEQKHAVCSRQTKEELDLFFDFLKKKIQYFSKEEITSIQVEFLNCVLRREAEGTQKQNSIGATL